jgi:hypothetical protein
MAMTLTQDDMDAILAAVVPAVAAAILATPANLLVTDASGRTEISGTKNTLDDLNDPTPALVWANGTRTLSAFAFTPSLDAAYDAAKTAAQAGDEMDLIDAPNATALAAIKTAIAGVGVYLTGILSTALSETGAGWLAAAFKKLFDVEVPVLTCESLNLTVTPAVAGDAMDIVDTPSATAVAALQSGLAVPGDAMGLTSGAAEAIAAEIPPLVLDLSDLPTKDEMDAAFAVTNALIANRAGGVEWPYRVVDNNGAPISGVSVLVTADDAGEIPIASGVTNALGYVTPTFYLPAGTTYFWSSKPGYEFVNPDVEEVA